MIRTNKTTWLFPILIALCTFMVFRSWPLLEREWLVQGVTFLVTIYDDVKIGERCLIQAGVVIGTDGLGCSRDENGVLTKFPHLGGVVMGNDIEVGANSQIAKGSFSDTIIEDGCKMNGLCFIAHNCHLERNVWITGNTMLCGSVHVGKNTTIFSSVIIRDQRTIGHDVTIGMGSVVTKSIPDGETWIGNPAKKFEKRKN